MFQKDDDDIISVGKVKIYKKNYKVTVDGEDVKLANKEFELLLFLASNDDKKDIYIYINSPGGLVSAGLAIYDTMNYVKCDIYTIGMGICASMGAFLLSSGTKGKRAVLQNTKVMIHQPLGGAKGQATDIMIVAEEIIKTKKQLNNILSKNTNQPISKIENDVERDYYLDAKEALKYGIVDKIL